MHRQTVNRPYKVISWQDPKDTGAMGWIVIHNLVNGVAGGGLCMHESVSLQEIKDLAYTMSLKNSLQAPLFGGAKGGIRFDASHPDASSVLKRFLQAHLDIIKTEWCTGGDINTTTQAITQHLTEISDIESPFICLAAMLQKQLAINFDSKKFHANLYAVENKFFTLEQAITGYSIFKTIETTLNPKTFKPKIIVQGFGKVGKGFCYYAQHHFEIVGICEKDWFIFDPLGIDIQGLLSLDSMPHPLDLKAWNPTKRYGSETNEDFLIRFLQQVRADIFCPCAMRYCITEKVLHVLSGQTFVNTSLASPYIIAGANNIFSQEDLITQAFAHNITVLPEWLSNAGSAILFMEALKFRATGYPWRSFIKQQVEHKIINFINQSNSIAQAYHLNIYEACCYLAQSIVSNSHKRLARTA